MNVLQKAFRAGSSLLKTKASRAGRLIALGMVGQPAWTPRRFEALAKESYEKNAVAYRAIAEISKCAGSVPFQLFQMQKGGEKIEIPFHPLLDLLRRPNPLQSQAAFMQAVIGFFLIAGNTYIERVGPRGQRPPLELWTKRPDRMKIIVGTRGIPKAYSFEASGGKVFWPVGPLRGESNILHVKSFHPLDDWYGMSAVQAAAYSIDQHNESGRWNMARLQNDARPSGALIVDPKAGTGLDDAQFHRLQAEIRAKYSSPDSAGEPLLLEGGLDWKEMGLSPIDMDWLNGKHTSARDIAMAFGMPAQMLGIPGDNTHRNMEEARLWLWEQTIMPLVDFIVGELNWWLTPLFGVDLKLFADYDNIPALITRRHTLWDKVQTATFLTVNEKRVATGYEERPEGDVIRTPKNQIELGNQEAEDAAAGIKKESEGEEEKPGKESEEEGSPGENNDDDDEEKQALVRVVA